MVIPIWKRDKKVCKLIEGIRSLKIQGSHIVAKNCIDILREIANKRGFESKEFNEMANFLQSLRPTQVLTYNLIEYVKQRRDMKAFSNINRFLENCYDEIFEKALNFLEGNEVILTHCHSSEELYVLKKAYELGYRFKVFVTETRPKLQGIKSAKELAKCGIKVKYIVDDAAGFYMDEVDAAIFGIDAITKDGVWNKIGTYMISLAAKHHAKDVLFIGDIMKIDLREYTYIEMRNPNEIISKRELNNPNIEILNPSFDLTPWHLIDAVITGKGVIKDSSIFEKISYEKLFNILDGYPINIENLS